MGMEVSQNFTFASVDLVKGNHCPPTKFHHLPRVVPSQREKVGS